MATSPTYPAAAGVSNIAKTIVNSDSTNWVTLYDNSGGSASVRVESLSITSDDTATVNIQFSRLISAVNYLIGTVRALTLSGTDGAAPVVNCMPSVGTYAPDGLPVIEVGAGAQLQAKSLAAVTAGKTVTISGWARLYN